MTNTYTIQTKLARLILIGKVYLFFILTKLLFDRKIGQSMIYRSKKQIAHAPSFANLSVKNHLSKSDPIRHIKPLHFLLTFHNLVRKEQLNHICHNLQFLPIHYGFLRLQVIPSSSFPTQHIPTLPIRKARHQHLK